MKQAYSIQIHHLNVAVEIKESQDQRDLPKRWQRQAKTCGLANAIICPAVKLASRLLTYYSYVMRVLSEAAPPGHWAWNRHDRHLIASVGCTNAGAASPFQKAR